jgi:hypothetical protein
LDPFKLHTAHLPLLATLTTSGSAASRHIHITPSPAHSVSVAAAASQLRPGPETTAEAGARQLMCAVTQSAGRKGR